MVPYLDIPQVATLSADLRKLSNIDGWIVDYFAPEVHAYREKHGVHKQMPNAPFRFKPDETREILGLRADA